MKTLNKKLSDYLISQIHFCRFTYKLLLRLKALPKANKISNNVLEEMIKYIFMMLDEIKNVRFISMERAKVFKQSQQFVKVSKITDEYIERYMEELKLEQQPEFNETENEKTMINVMAEQILRVYKSLNLLYDFSHCPEIVVSLDLMITFLQFMKLRNKKGIDGFHNLSQISKIVEAKISLEVKTDHFKAIKEKLMVLKLI